MVEKKLVDGKNKGYVMLYALSTCVWCKKTKKLLDEEQIKYQYVYVDKIHGEDKKEIIKELEEKNPARSFPTLVINDKSIVGYKEDEIKKSIG